MLSLQCTAWTGKHEQEMIFHSVAMELKRQLGRDVEVSNHSTSEVGRLELVGVHQDSEPER